MPKVRCPKNDLKQPVLRFEDTFSAETVVLKFFFARVMATPSKRSGA